MCSMIARSASLVSQTHPLTRLRIDRASPLQTILSQKKNLSNAPALCGARRGEREEAGRVDGGRDGVVRRGRGLVAVGEERRAVPESLRVVGRVGEDFGEDFGAADGRAGRHGALREAARAHAAATAEPRTARDERVDANAAVGSDARVSRGEAARAVVET